MIQPVDGVERIVVVGNPHSTHADRIERSVIKPLHAMGSTVPIEVFKTRNPENFNNIDWLATEIQAGDLVFACGGDGMANIAANAVAQSESDALLVPLGFGNANDIASSLHRRPLTKRRSGRIIDIVRKGERQQLGAIEFVEDDSVPMLALGYLGIGFTAEAAVEVDDDDHRARKATSFIPDKLLDGWAVARTLRRVSSQEPVEAEIDGELVVARELLWAVGRRMADTVRFRTGRFGDVMLHNRFVPEGFISRLALRGISEMPLGGFKGIPTHESHLRLLSSAVLQYDGETRTIKEGQELRITHKPSAVKTLILPEAA